MSNKTENGAVPETAVKEKLSDSEVTTHTASLWKYNPIPSSPEPYPEYLHSLLHIFCNLNLKRTSLFAGHTTYTVARMGCQHRIMLAHRFRNATLCLCKI